MEYVFRYRELIIMTIKENFLVIVIDELFDELQGVISFTKLGPHFGYHQIKIRKHNIMKTTFRTHGGHYEILVMPFVLTSAPSTFESLMNSILKPLKKLISIF